jgi:MFS family permease
MYLVLQGIGWFLLQLLCIMSRRLTIFDYTAPMVWGTISDRRGRRPITAACLLILSLSCVGLALVPTSDYWLLMILRCVQAAGSASTIAIGRIY